MAAQKVPGKMPAFIRNPLTVIGVFAGLSEVMGLWVLPKLQSPAADTFLWFVMGFPVLLVVLFFATLNFNHKCLYAPSDYRADDAFMDTIRGVPRFTAEEIRKGEAFAPEVQVGLSGLEQLIGKKPKGST